MWLPQFSMWQIALSLLSKAINITLRRQRVRLVFVDHYLCCGFSISTGRPAAIQIAGAHEHILHQSLYLTVLIKLYNNLYT